MSEAKSRVYYFTLLRRQLDQLGINVQLFYQNGTVEPGTQSIIYYLLNSPTFEQPELLSSLGYPQPAIREAERVAMAEVQRSVTRIKKMYFEVASALEESDQEGLAHETSKEKAV